MTGCLYTVDVSAVVGAHCMWLEVPVDVASVILKHHTFMFLLIMYEASVVAVVVGGAATTVYLGVANCNAISSLDS